MTPRLQRLSDSIKDLNPVERLGELAVEVKAADYLRVAERLRRDGFEQLIDLCGMDYGAYADRPRGGHHRHPGQRLRGGRPVSLNQKQIQTKISRCPNVHEKRGLSLISGLGC